MHRFYIPSVPAKNSIITISDSRRFHQISRVLRMRPGHRFSVFNEKGEEWTAQIIEIGKSEVTAQLIERLSRQVEPNLEVSLYQAIPKKTGLFEWVIEKATELGVSHIYPLITEHTEKRRLSKFERMAAIAMEATEQSGRLKIPTIHHPVYFEDILPKTKNAFMAYEFEGAHFLKDYAKELEATREISFFIGPEGGFAEKEVNFAKEKGAHLFTLGPRILRTETAAIAALSLALCNPTL